MSQENLEIVRRAYAALNGGEIEAAVEFLHPEIEWRPYLGAVESDIYRSREAVIGMWSQLEEGFGGTLRIKCRELIDVGERGIVAVVEASGVGSGSGAEVRQRWAQLVTIRDGLVVLVEPFHDKDTALEAAGLRE
jgi:ketosteroid isomerase-like protein